jgi:hypothetical protein
MLSVVSLETCWALNKHWNNKFYYKVAFCWLFLLIHTAMHGSMNIKLTTFMCRLSLNLENSASWKPQGLSRSVMGLPYLYVFISPLNNPFPVSCRLPSFPKSRGVTLSMVNICRWVKNYPHYRYTFGSWLYCWLVMTKYTWSTPLLPLWCRCDLDSPFLSWVFLL